MLIYKILLPAEWAAFRAAQRFDGSPFDLSCGFVHCSARDQVAATALRVFAGEPDLFVAAVDSALLGDTVHWEDAPNGGPFPHVYGPLPLTAVTAVHRVPGAAHVEAVLAGSPQ
ncbi:DUF952 domain-containing protein [Catellatospora sp. TT07R-123]|uniref:DUF952 domain-containing protein n=1 Tax=Catellatospora sp. TT07R-123 TaxID=2733863 RepID=UPI001FD34018|nr:DUF952 domain-containing protein [Catellatospora sp. TT07R-123]